jgi:hypothetical protein
MDDGIPVHLWLLIIFGNCAGVAYGLMAWFASHPEIHPLKSGVFCVASGVIYTSAFAFWCTGMNGYRQWRRLGWLP